MNYQQSVPPVPVSHGYDDTKEAHSLLEGTGAEPVAIWSGDREEARVLLSCNAQPTSDLATDVNDESSSEAKLLLQEATMTYEFEEQSSSLKGIIDDLKQALLEEQMAFRELDERLDLFLSDLAKEELDDAEIREKCLERDTVPECLLALCAAISRGLISPG